MKVRIGVIAGLVAASSVLLPATAQAVDVDYTQTAKCAYFVDADGWASVGRSPRGTVKVEYTMRTGEPGDWSAETITATAKARKWRIVTDPGMSFINWVTFLDADGHVLASQNVNVRCAGTPSNWPR